LSSTQKGLPFPESLDLQEEPVPQKELEEAPMDQTEDLKMRDGGCSRSEKEQAKHVYHNSHRHMSEGSRWMSRYTSSLSKIPAGSLHDEPTSSQAE